MNLLSKIFTGFGRYWIFVWRCFSIPEKMREFVRRTVQEIQKLGIDSIPLVILISVFMGAVCTIQMKLNVNSPLLPRYSVGMATREIILLEFSSSILCLILAGKVGSNIASEIGTMRVTEQIDALEIMGINSASFLVLPKILGFVLYIPVLVIFCMATSLFGGYAICVLTNIVDVDTYLYGVQTMFIPWYVWYGIIKSLFFAFSIASISSFFGYYVDGGALQVGKASTNAVVTSSIVILILDVLLTKILLQ
ncbi:MAG: ABC transporter permease [Bacteroidaceae bacterium]|nr:ABC transporter permease [Bacteroidaceae bacterium]